LGEQKVLVIGNITIDSPVYVESYTYLEIRGYWTLADNSDCSMIKNVHQSTEDNYVTIDGGGLTVLDGNRANQNSGNGIEFICNVSYIGYYLKIEGLLIRDVKGDACHLKYLVEVYLSQCQLLCEGYGLYCYSVSDSYIDHLLPIDGYGANPSCMLDNCHANFIHDIYVNNGMIIRKGRGNIYRSFIFDSEVSSFAFHGLELQGVQWDTFSDFNFRIQEDTSVTNLDAIRLSSYGYHCQNNTFTNILASRRTGTGSNQWNYTIHETDSNQTYNIYSVINGGDCVGGALRVLGVNSTYCADTIIGTIDTS